MSTCRTPTDALQEYSDVQLTSYLTSLTKQLAALSDVSESGKPWLTCSIRTSIILCSPEVVVMMPVKAQADPEVVADSTLEGR